MGFLGIDLGEFFKDVTEGIDDLFTPDPANVAARQEGRTARTEARQEGRSERQGNRQETRSIRSIQGNSLNDLAMRHSDNVTGLLGEALPYAAAAAAAAALGGPAGALGGLGGLGGSAPPPAPPAPTSSLDSYMLPLGVAIVAGLALAARRK